MAEEKKEEKVELLSIISDLVKKVNDNNADTLRHCLFGMEIEDSGKPGTVIFKLEGDPIALLGMIEMLQSKIEELKDEIKEDIGKAQHKSKTKNSVDIVNDVMELLEKMKTEGAPTDMPIELQQALAKYSKELTDAVVNKDAKRLSELRELVIKEAIRLHLAKETSGISTNPEDVLDQIKKKIDEIKDNPASDDDIDIKNIM